MFFQFREACRGIGDACRAFGTPVTGGNVSFYNESPDRRHRSHADHRNGRAARAGRGPGAQPLRRPGRRGLHPGAHRGDPGRLGLLGEVLRLRRWRSRRRWTWRPSAGCSGCWPPQPSGGLLRSAHDCSDGGLAVALAEAAMGGPYAAAAPGREPRSDRLCTRRGAPEALLYGEDGARAVVTCAPDAARSLLALARSSTAVPVFRGRAVWRAPGGPLELRVGSRRVLAGTPQHLRRIYFDAIPRRMQHPDVDRSVGE